MTELHMPVWNRPKMTEIVIRTLHRNTNTPYKLVVLDNGSDEETQDVLCQLKGENLIDTLIVEKENKGLEAARQRMYRQTTSEFFVDIDNDCLAPPTVDGKDWLTQLCGLMNKYPDYGAISLRTDPMVGTGNIFEQADEYGDDIVEFPHPGGSFRIMRTRAVQLSGGWDRKNPGRGAEERYIGDKLHKTGYGTAFATNIRTLHLFGLLDTDNWGYDKSMVPEDSGHSSGVWHPKFDVGDVYEEVVSFAGEELAKEYFSERIL